MFCSLFYWKYTLFNKIINRFVTYNSLHTALLFSTSFIRHYFHPVPTVSSLFTWPCRRHRDFWKLNTLSETCPFPHPPDGRNIKHTTLKSTLRHFWTTVSRSHGRPYGSFETSRLVHKARSDFERLFSGRSKKT